MKARGLLVAAILLAAFSVTLYVLNKKGKLKDSTEASETTTKKEEKLFNVNATDIQDISIKPASGDKITIERSGDKWKIIEPQNVPADDSALSSMTSTLSGLSATDTIDEKPASLKDYGLDPPKTAVEFKTKSGATQTVYLGEDTPTGNSVYVKTGDKPRVVTIASFAKTDLTKSLFDLRDKSILKLDTNTASKVWLQNKSGKMELDKGGDRWDMAQPSKARLDQTAVNDLLRAAADAKMQSAPSDETDAKAGLNSPEIVFTAQDSTGRHELKLSAEKDSKRYGRSSDQNGIFTVASDLATSLGKAATDLCDKDVFSMDTWLASHVDVTTPEAHVVLNKQGEKWQGSDPKKAPDASAVSDLLDKLKAIRATSFPATAPHWDKPALSVQDVWGQNNQKETVEIGVVGEKAYARRQGDPAVYEVSADAVKSARDAANKLK